MGGKISDRVSGLELAHRRELGQRFFVKRLDGVIVESGRPDREWSYAELQELERAGYQLVVFKIVEDKNVPGQSR